MADNEEKLRLKRERNKESARESRKRKKEKTDEIKKQITMLEASNLQLRLQLNVGFQPELSSDNNFMKSQIAGRLNKLLKDGASDEEIQTTIKQIQEKYSDYGVDRRSAISFHIHQLRKALRPTLTTRTMLWLVKVAQPFLSAVKDEELVAAFGDNYGTIRALFLSLMDELQPQPEQVRLLMLLGDDSVCATKGDSLTRDLDESSYKYLGRGMFDRLDSIATETDQKLDLLESMISSKNICLESETKELHKILTGKQMARFIIWVDKNPACMLLLEALWPHITT